MIESPLAGLSQRLPPQNLEAEQALLGAILTNNASYDRAVDHVAPEHFADPVHGRIFEACARRISQGRIADAVSLRSDLANDALLADAGGAGYLGQLVAASVAIINAADYARAIRDCWLRRELIDAAAEAVDGGFQPPPDGDGTTVLDSLETRLFALSHGVDEKALVSAGDATAAAVRATGEAAKRGDGVSGLATGYAALDRMTAGFQAGQLYVLGARPSMGKTAIGLSIAARVAARENPVLFVSPEMSAQQLGVRLAAAAANLDTQAVLTAKHLPDPDPESPNHDAPVEPLRDPEDWQALARAEQQAGALPLLIDDRAAPTVARIRAMMRRMLRRGGLKLVVIDYLSKLQASQSAQRAGLYAATTELAQHVAALAKETNVPILLLAQLNRNVETREDRRPGLHDLRDSGAIEQEAFAVLLLHREHYYLTKSKPVAKPSETDEKYYARVQAWATHLRQQKGRGELLIVKNRQGITGPVRLRFDDPTTWFYDETDGAADADDNRWQRRAHPWLPDQPKL